MKTKIILLIAFVCLSFTSCIKDYHGGGPEDVVLTKTNFVYEGDIFEFYINTEINNLEEEIKILKSISPDDPKFNQAQEDIYQAEEKQGELKFQNSIIIDLELVGLDIKPLPPLPPCTCFGLRNSLEYFLTTSNTNIISFSIKSIDGKVLSKMSTEFDILSDYEGEILFDRFVVEKELKGEVLLTIEKFDTKGAIQNYTVRAYIE